MIPLRAPGDVPKMAVARSSPKNFDIRREETTVTASNTRTKRTAGSQTLDKACNADRFTPAPNSTAIKTYMARSRGAGSLGVESMPDALTMMMAMRAPSSAPCGKPIFTPIKPPTAATAKPMIKFKMSPLVVYLCTTVSTLIHLVRHAEVENPGNIWYGRLDGFVLSERGLRQTQALGAHFANHDIRAVYSSPLVRAVQTAEAIAYPHVNSLSVEMDEDLIESETKLQGMPGDRRLFRNPMNLRHFLNPFRPSWGESYASIQERLERAIKRMRDAHGGGEVVAVSHMTPILVARLAFEGKPKPPWRASLPCARASVTTIKFDGERYVSTRYEPVGTTVV